MKSLVEQLARESRLSSAEAAERVDRAVCDVLRRLKRGRSVHIPGVGRLVAGAITTLVPEVARVRRRKQ
jgi:nucleoid DNA-binding protein